MVQQNAIAMRTRSPVLKSSQRQPGFAHLVHQDADFRGWFLRKGVSHMNTIQKHYQNLENVMNRIQKPQDLENVYENVMKTQDRSHN